MAVVSAVYVFPTAVEVSSATGVSNIPVIPFVVGILAVFGVPLLLAPCFC